MRYLALATDYDGTLAHDGIVDESTVGALDRLRQSGRKLLLVTGRELPDLFRTFAHVDKFDRVVAENGALLYNPATGKETPLADPPPPEFADRIRSLGATPFSTGRVIVATRTPWEQPVLETIREMGLELQVIFNKGAVMVLPSGVNKATGLKCALEDLGLSPHNTVGVGDAENDHAFLAICEASVAVANALPALKDRSDLVTNAVRGAGVHELIERLLDDDLESLAPRLARHDLRMGTAGGQPVCMPVFGSTILLAGISGGGKSTLTTGFMEGLNRAGYQFCAFDPEGDYSEFPNSVVLGDANKAASADEILSVLNRPSVNAIVNLLAVRFDERPQYFNTRMSALQKYRERTGRPHWLVIDEAHHVLPASDIPPEGHISLRNCFLVTLDPARLNRRVHGEVTDLIAVGEKPGVIFKSFARLRNIEHAPAIENRDLKKGEALFWRIGSSQPPLLAEALKAEAKNERHSRKYATVELTPDRSFYFRGADGRLNLRAHNLATFVQMMEGVDDETWLFHLRRGEYSAWFRDNIKNEELAESAREIEQSESAGAEDSRAAVRAEIEKRYALPA